VRAAEEAPDSAREIWTVGHSNHTLAAFQEILAVNRVEQVLDVRRFPVSRRLPHFNAESLSKSLVSVGIRYAGFPELGGRRTARPASPHVSWRVQAFRGYADFMDTQEFQEGLGRLMAHARQKRSALMCAEALPWRCHRSLIADALLARGWTVCEILSKKETRPRVLPVFARLEGTRVVYDGPQQTLPL